jgi:dihydrofolate reductase
MSKVFSSVAVSIDGFIAGIGLSEDKPFGHISPSLLHSWRSAEPEKHKAVVAELTSRAGAYILGRNMYGPPGPKYDSDWKGWWGEDPVYHAPVFILTHRPREKIVMKGGTSFTFVTDGIESALRQAKKAAGNRDISIGGGANVINQYLAAGLIDELSLHIVPVTINKGARLFDDVKDLLMEPVEISGTKLVTHIRYRVISPKSKL